MTSLSAISSLTVSDEPVPVTFHQRQLLVSSKTAWLATDGCNFVEIDQGGARIANKFSFEGIILALAPRPGQTNDIAVLTGSEVVVIMASIEQRAFQRHASTDQPYMSMSWHPGGDILAVASLSSISILSIKEGLEPIGHLPVLKAKSTIHICWSASSLLVCSDGGSFILKWKQSRNPEMKDAEAKIDVQIKPPRCLLLGPCHYLMSYDSPVTLYLPPEISVKPMPCMKAEDLGDCGASQVLDLRGKFKESSPTGLFNIHTEPSVPSSFLLERRDNPQTTSSSKSKLVLSDGFSINLSVDFKSITRPDIVTTSPIRSDRCHVFVASSTGKMGVEIFYACGGLELSDCSLHHLAVVSLEVTIPRCVGDITAARLCGLDVLSMPGSTRLGALYGSLELDPTQPSLNFFTKLTKTGVGATRLSSLHLDVFEVPVFAMDQAADGPSNPSTPQNGPGDIDISIMLASMIDKMEARLMMTIMTIDKRLGRLESQLDLLLRERKGI